MTCLEGGIEGFGVGGLYGAIGGCLILGSASDIAGKNARRGIEQIPQGG